jgi:hypothetical protein
MEVLEIRKEIVLNLKQELPELVDKFNPFILTVLKSKKNKVSVIKFNKQTERFPKEIVVKIFRTKNADIEYETLNRLKDQDISVPRIIYYKNPFLILEKVKGINLCDYINEKLRKQGSLDELDGETKKKINQSIPILAAWIAQFHTKNIIANKHDEDITVLNKGDARIRDFIYEETEEVISGTDFEDCYQGNHMDDLAWVCCSLLDTNPGIFEMNDPRIKIDLINLFLKSYYNINNEFTFNYKYFAEKLLDNLNEVIKRRGLSITINKSNFIEEISKNI